MKVEEDDYDLGYRDGYKKAVQDIDLMTGGDGEYVCCTSVTDKKHCPTPSHMKARIKARFEDHPNE